MKDIEYSPRSTAVIVNPGTTHAAAGETGAPAGQKQKNHFNTLLVVTGFFMLSTLVFAILYWTKLVQLNASNDGGHEADQARWLDELNDELNEKDAWEEASIGDKPRLRLIVALFDGFELLDAFGPLEFFSTTNFLPVSYEIIFVAETQFIKSRGGVTIHADHIFSDGPLDEPADLLLLPGANPHHSEAAADNTALLDFLRREGERAANVMTVCTGAGIFARTGLLTGRNATSNKMLFKWVSEQDPGANWIYDPRWVVDGKYWTSSGVSAGCDTALAYIEAKHGEDVADYIADLVEWSSPDRPYEAPPNPLLNSTTPAPTASVTDAPTDAPVAV